MKLMFSKTGHHGQWFHEEEDTTGFTEKVPPHTGVIFDESTQEWILPPAPVKEALTVSDK